jgi:multicomponent Na+:H+ antiporter subunit B
MSRRARYAVFAVGAAGLAVLLAWGFAGLPPFGDFGGVYGTLLPKIAPPERHVTSVVAAATFDYRGLDTLGEELILFASAVGVLTLMRVQRSTSGSAGVVERVPTARSRSLRTVLPALAGPVLVIGIYIVTHGQLTPGGGFQGGVVLMSSLLLIYLAGARLSLGRLAPIEGMEIAEGVGSAGFALIGVGGLLIAGSFLENFLPLGRLTYLWSGGTIPILNVAVGLEVLGATLAVLSEMADHMLIGQGEKP